MADLEEQAFKRDKRFVVRLVLALLVGLVAGAFIYTKLTGPGVGGCASRAFQKVTNGSAAPPGGGK